MPGFDELYTSDAKKLFDSNDAELLVLGNGLSIGFCVSSAEENRLDKTAFLSAYEWIGGTLREESSIIAPTITVEHGSFPNWNYAYIPNFNRYYFITDIVSVRLNIWRISFRCDPLMSFKEIIRETKAMVARNEFDFDVRVNDDIYPAIYGKEVEEYDAAEIGDATIEFIPDKTLTLKRHIAVTTIVPFRGNNSSANPDSPDPGYLPKVITNNFVGSSCYKTYAMTEDEFLRLSKYILAHDNKGTFLISAINYPYDIPWDRTGEADPVYLGDSAVIDLTEPDDMVLYSRSATLPFWSYAILGSVFTNSGTEFDRFEPYSMQEIYVPYSGWCKLPLDAVQGQTGHRIICYYAIDHINGTATAYLYDKTAHRAIWSAPAQIGYKIGINSTNAYENRRTEEANNANLILSSLGAVVSTAAGIITQNPIMVAGGILGEAKAISSYNITKSGILDRAQAEMSAGVSGISSYPRLRHRITRILSNSYGDQDFNHQYGRPLNQVRVIGNLTGHTVVSSVHLEIPGAYPSEVNEIEALLKEGFIA